MRYVLVFVACLGMNALESTAQQYASPAAKKWIEQLKSADEAQVLEAIDNLGHNKVVAAVEPLMKLLTSPSVKIRADAADALGNIGAEAKPAAEALAKLIDDPEASVRKEAAEALYAIRPGPAIGVPVVAKLMKDPDPKLRAEAMNVLTEAGAEAVPFLKEALKDPKNGQWACLVISEIGPAAKELVPMIGKIAADSDDPEVDKAAFLALGAIGPAAASELPQIVEALGEERRAAVATYALISIGKVSDEAKAKILANKKSENKVVAAASIWAIAKLSPNDNAALVAAVNDLVDLLKHPNEAVRRVAARALGSLKAPAAIAIPAIQRAFENADEKIATAALGAVVGLGEEGVPLLIDLLKLPKAKVHIVSILGEMGPKAAGAVDALAGLLQDENEEVRREAAIALGKIGPAAKKAVPQLAKAVQSDDEALAEGAAFALGELGKDGREGLSVLLKGIESKNESLALICAIAVCKVDPGCPNCCGKGLNVLRRGVLDEATVFQLESISALKGLGAFAKPAIPELKQALEDDDLVVREAAKAALEVIEKK